MDNLDGDLTSSIIADASSLDITTVGVYETTYTVSDAAGNTATATRDVRVRDITPPVITILSDNPFYIDQGDTYNDPGATADDNVDGDVTANISSDANAISTLSQVLLK